MHDRLLRWCSLSKVRDPSGSDLREFRVGRFHLIDECRGLGRLRRDIEDALDLSHLRRRDTRHWFPWRPRRTGSGRRRGKPASTCSESRVTLRELGYTSLIERLPCRRFGREVVKYEFTVRGLVGSVREFESGECLRGESQQGANTWREDLRGSSHPKTATR